jgi:hypothetical protein
MPENNERNDAASPLMEAKTISSAKVDYSSVQTGARFYANHVQTGATLFDVRLVFSDVDPSTEGLKANSIVTILMSPELATILEAGLRSVIETYTESFGKARLPEGAIKVQQSKLNIAGAQKPPDKPESGR